MGLAAAAFHWSPETYWRATRHEYFAAYEQWLKLLPMQSNKLGDL
jgi:hypothetical protein